MAEEAADLTAALYWTDRTAQWARVCRWRSMVAYAYVRRSMLASSFTSDGPAAVEQAKLALQVPGVPPRIQALANKQIAYGFAGREGKPQPVRPGPDSGPAGRSPHPLGTVRATRGTRVAQVPNSD